MDTLDRKYEIKKFLKTIFDGIDFREECIGILILNEEKGINVQMKFRDFDLLVNTIVDSKYIKFCNIYYYTCSFKALSETYTDKDICKRYCLACDFDRKDYSSLDMNKAIKLYKRSGLSYHTIVDTSGGYHIYSCIEPTQDFEKLKAINKELKQKTNCDARALHVNQILRLPYTFNTKQYNKTNDIKDRKQVNIVVDCNRYNKSFKRYKIEDIYEWLVTNKLPQQDNLLLTGDRGIAFCVEDALKNGTLEGHRHETMVNIIGYFKSRGEDKETTRDMLEAWATLSDFNKEFDAKFDYYWSHNREDKENGFYGFYFDCANCKDEKICGFIHKSKCIGTFEFDESYKIEDYDNKLWERSIKDMNGNELLICMILYSDRDIKENGMTRGEILKELTYKKKSRMSERLLSTTLKSLVEKKYVIINKGNARLKVKDTFKISDKFINMKEENKINISNMSISMCVVGAITPEELRFYIFLRLLHEKEDKQGKSTYVGSYICKTQEQLGKEYKRWGGGTSKQQNISRMINNLCDCRMMKLVEQRESEKNKYKYNIYKLYC